MLLFLVVGRRPCLVSSLRSPLRVERGSCARRATNDTRAARAARVNRGWFSPPQSSRGVGAVFSSCPLLSSCLSRRAAPSLHPHAGGGARAPRAGSRRTQRAIRRTRRAGSPSALRSRSSRPPISRARRSGLRCSLLPVPRAPLPRSAAGARALLRAGA